MHCISNNTTLHPTNFFPHKNFKKAPKSKSKKFWKKRQNSESTKACKTDPFAHVSRINKHVLYLFKGCAFLFLIFANHRSRTRNCIFNVQRLGNKTVVFVAKIFGLFDQPYLKDNKIRKTQKDVVILKMQKTSKQAPNLLNKKHQSKRQVCWAKNFKESAKFGGQKVVVP